VTSYELIFEDRAKYLYVLVSGELNTKTDHEIDAEIKSQCERRERSEVLIDIRHSSSRLNFLENFVAATSYRQRMGSYIRAIAIVDSREYQENSELFELAAVNQGARLKFFNSTVRAEQWLMENRNNTRW
jgi:hypothetical protein